MTATKGQDAPNSIGAGKNSTAGTVTIGGVADEIAESPYTYPAPATATYKQVGGDYEAAYSGDKAASLWQVTVTPGKAAIETLSVRVNGNKEPKAPLSIGTSFSGGGSIAFGVVLNGIATDVQTFTALVNGEAVTTTVE